MEQIETKKRFSTKKLALMAMFIALQVVLSKFLMLQATPSIRLSIDAVPVLLAGLWFGPIAGGIVGVLADLVGTVLFPTAGAYYPPLTVAFLLLGLIAGFIGKALLKINRPLWRIALCTIPAELIASLLWKTLALSWLYGTPFFVMLGTRILPVCGVAVADALIVFALDRLLRSKLLAEPAGAEIADETAVRMDYAQTLDYIHHVTWRGSRLGLARTRELLEKTGNPHKDLKFIHIAGTNGKGSTLAMLSSVLQCAGYTTGSYSSPFIDRFNERMQVNGIPIADDELAEITSFVRPFADGMADHPTEFELITVIAMLYFKKHACDIVVLEVGMGGALDSTNVIDTPELAIITNMGLDHTRELGPTIADIARAKAGIIKESGDVVAYGLNDEANAVFEAACAEKRARLIYTDHSRIRETGMDLDALRFDFTPIYKDLCCHLVGSYQLHNAAVTLTAIEVLQNKGWHISEQAVRDGLASVRWPARFEILSRDPLFIIDGGHNPQGVEAAIASIRAHLPNRKIVFLLGIMADKDVPHMLEQIAPIAQSVVTVTPSNPRAMQAGELAGRVRSFGIDAVACDSIRAGLDRAFLEAGKDGVVCALGSLYMLGDIRALTGAQHG